MPFLGTRGAGTNKAFGFAGAGVPNQVTGLIATDFGTSRAYNNGLIDLSWTAPANNGAAISGYKIERSTDNITYSNLSANTGTSSTTYSDISLNSAQIYYYKVSAINTVGTGLVSTVANATATTVPQAPTIGTATNGNAFATAGYTTGATGGKTITTFTVTSSPTGLTGTGASPITVSGLTNGTAYTFVVHANNANGASANSAASNSVTPVAPESYSLSQTFNTSGTYTVPAGKTRVAAYLIGGGGGGGALVEGSGGGGLSAFSGVTTSAGSTFTVTVGAGGTSGTGGTTTFGNLATANGGGMSKVPGNGTSNAAVKSLSAGAAGGNYGGYGAPGPTGGAAEQGPKTVTLNATGLVSISGSFGGGGGGGGGVSAPGQGLINGGNGGPSGTSGGNGGKGGSGTSNGESLSQLFVNAGNPGNASLGPPGSAGGGGGAGGYAYTSNGQAKSGQGGNIGVGQRGVVHVYISD